MASSTLDRQVCKDCGSEKPVDQFYWRSDSRKPRSECKACSIAKLRAKGEKRTAQDFRDTHLRRTFGITQADFDAMLAVQDGCCAICKRSAEDSYKGLHVDHDHESGRVRGLLCHKCNMALGLLGDSVSALADAIAYLDHARRSA